jgi:Uma2 family endonuclease
VKLRVDDFDLLAENGGLVDLERTELLDGDIYLMAPQYSLHSFAKSLFYDALLDWTRANRPDLFVRTETSVAMPPNDEPMPDVILTGERRGQKGIPAATIMLLIEIADESRDRDLGYKAQLYAQQNVPEYWVVDLKERVVVQHSGASEAGFEVTASLPFGDAVRAATLAGLAVDTGELLD